jgi:hypothetical protein
MTRIVCIAALVFAAGPAYASGPPELVSKLNKTVSMKAPIDAALDLVLTELAEEHGLTGKILLDVPAFKAAGVEDIRAAMVKLDRLNDVKVSTVLKGLLNQVDGTYLVRDTHILITTRAARRAELGERDDDPDAAVRDAVPLVRITFTDTTLRKALEELATKFDRTIVVAPQAAEKGDTQVSAKLINVPLDHAVELLAEMSDLALVKRGNALFVTTPERAAALKNGK